MSQNSNLFLSVGKQLKDEYGCPIGKIASFAVTPGGKFESVFVELGDGQFSKYSTEHLKFDGADITLVSSIKAQAAILCDQLPLIWRKDQAVKELSDKKKISRESYLELHTCFEGLLTQLKTETQALMEDIDEQTGRCADQIKGLNHALVNLEVEHEIGKVDNPTYETAFAMIQSNVRRIHSQKTDLDLTKSRLSNIILGEPSKIKGMEMPRISNPVPPAPELPEPPVVVYVKEIGKTGI
jgi:hypothetical protein